MKRNRLLTMALAVGLTLVNLTTTASAHVQRSPRVCHNSTPYDVVMNDKAGFWARENPKIGVCNNNGGYQSRFRLTRPPRDPQITGGVFLSYQTAFGTYYSVVTKSTTYVNGPVLSVSTKNAPLYFNYAADASFVGTTDTIILSGPWSNYGF